MTDNTMSAQFQGKITIPLKVRVEIDHEELKKYLAEQERLKASSFIVSDTIVETKCYGKEKGYAEFLEFGTGISHTPDAHEPFKIGKKGRQAIYEWVKRKLGIKNEKEAKARTNAICKNIELYGMTPKPFFRPAVYPIFDRCQELLDEGYSFRDMCERMMQDCSQNLLTAGFQGGDLNDTGNMLMSFRFGYTDELESSDQKVEDYVDTNADRVWDSYRKSHPWKQGRL